MSGDIEKGDRGPRLPIFDYRTLRLMMGLIALGLPLCVVGISTRPLTSISAAYHTEARDTFVGLMFVVGACLCVYNGHSATQRLFSKIAAAAAVLAGMFPAACDGCPRDVRAYVHYAAAGTLFAVLTYFCFAPFRENTKGRGGKKGRRSKLYFGCGCAMTASIVGVGVSELVFGGAILRGLPLTLFFEALALAAFGVAWFVSSKVIGIFAEPDEKLRLFTRRAEISL